MAHSTSCQRDGRRRRAAIQPSRFRKCPGSCQVLRARINRLGVLGYVQESVTAGPHAHFDSYTGFVMFTITRETIYLINLRQAYLLSPWNASRLSTRTVLFTSVPRDYRDEERLRRIFSSVNQIWLEPNYKDLEGIVEDRDSTALKLEQAEIQLSKEANKRRLKAMKNKDLGHNGSHDSDNRRWIDPKKRPSHRLAAVVGKKVDTIDYCRRRLSKLLPKIETFRRNRLGGKQKLVNAVFIEFETQAAAQAAFTMVVHNKPESMVPRQIAVPPRQIVWKNLRMTAYEANVRWILATVLIVAMILFCKS